MLAMNDGMLRTVCGGNFGDCDKDTDPNNPCYQVGASVKYYNFPLIHFMFTQNATIRDSK